MKRTATLLAAALAAFALAAAEPAKAPPPAGDALARVTKEGRIVFGVKADAPPFGLKKADGTYCGFDIDIAREIAKEMGLKAEFVAVRSQDRIAFVKDGKADAVIASMTVTREREREVDFTIPYFQDGQGLLALKGGPVKGYQDLKGRKVGAVVGATAFKNISKVQPDCEVVGFSGYPEAMKALLDERVSAVTSDTLILMGLMEESPQREKLELKGPRFTVEPYGIAIAENQSRLRDRLNEAIMAMWENGRWQDIYDTWFGEGSRFRNENPFHVQVIP